MSLLTTGTASITQLWEAFHDHYFPEVIDQFPKHINIINRLDTEKTSGRQMKFKHKIGGNYNAKAVAERGATPTAKGLLFKEYTASTKYVYSAMDITGPMIHQCNGPEEFINTLQEILTDCMTNMQHKCNFISMNNGSGRIAQVNGTPSYDGTAGTTTVTFDNGTGLHFSEYQTVRAGSDTTDYTIQEVDIANNQIVLAGNAVTDFADDEWIYHEDEYDSGLDVHPLGLKGHINSSNPPSGSYQGLDRTATGYDYTQAYVLNQSSAAMTELAFAQFLDEIYIRSKKVPNLVITEQGVRNSWRLILSAKHQNMEPVVTKTGFGDTLKYTHAGQDVDIEVVLDCEQGTIYGINTDHIRIMESKPLGYVNEMGNAKLMKKSGYDIYEGLVSWFFQIICDNPRAFGAWTNIKRNNIT